MLPLTRLEYGQVTDLPSIYIADSGSYANKWNLQSTRYYDAWFYFTGLVLEETIEVDGKPQLRYPLQINLVKQAVRMHAAYALGQYEADHVIEFNVRPTRKTVDVAFERANTMKEWLEGFWRANNAVTLMREFMRLYVAFGGVFFKVLPPIHKGEKPRVIGVPAQFVKPVWNPTNYKDLLRVHVCYQIDMEVAKSLYGYKPAGDEETVGVPCQYVETWTKTRYEVTINGQIAIDPATNQPMTGTVNIKHPKTGEAMLPWVYIARLRTGDFYGDPLPQDLMGLMDEYNARLTDIGDAVAKNANPPLWGRDIKRSKGSGPIRLNNGIVNDMGDTIAGGKEPFVEQITPPDVKEGMLSHNSTILQVERDVAQLSPVMFGADEGSQRSGQTLAMRALPTMSMIDDYRASWSEAILRINEIALVLAIAKQDPDAAEIWFDQIVEVMFAPILPKDREGIINENVALYGAGLRSLELALKRIPDVDDPELEAERIAKELKARQQQELNAQKQLNQQQADIQAEQGEQQLGQQKQQLALDQKGHDQQITNKEEAHQQQLRHGDEKHAQSQKQGGDKMALADKMEKQRATHDDARQKRKTRGVKGSSSSAAKGAAARKE